MLQEWKILSLAFLKVSNVERSTETRLSNSRVKSQHSIVIYKQWIQYCYLLHSISSETSTPLVSHKCSASFSVQSTRSLTHFGNSCQWISSTSNCSYTPAVRSFPFQLTSSNQPNMFLMVGTACLVIYIERVKYSTRNFPLFFFFFEADWDMGMYFFQRSQKRKALYLGNHRVISVCKLWIVLARWLLVDYLDYAPQFTTIWS